DAFGYRQVIPAREPMSVDTIFDLASLTKVVATLPAILHLVQTRVFSLDDPLKRHLPIPATHPLGDATIEQLLTHSAGLPPRTSLNQYGHARRDMLRGLLDSPLDAPPGANVIYSNRGFLILGLLIESVSSLSLDRYVSKHVWTPLGMHETWFSPPEAVFSRVAPTEFRERLGSCQRGTVHDENAALLGGVAGHAGVFSTARDLARFCAVIMASVRQASPPILDPELVRLSLRDHTPTLNESRGLGWEIETGEDAEELIFSHLGFTGTSIHLNPARDMFVLLLANRVHPTRDDPDSIREIRREVARLCWRLADRH
ncbi:MAG TPA: serine hydrolase domain-containing protein, partial [Thermomicrobiales bacterium]|nr:serine hydrolase domain-containing protein [Thermomicrobiales bacterium]